MKQKKSVKINKKQKDKEKEKNKDITTLDIFQTIFRSYGEGGTDENKKEASKKISAYLKQEVTKHSIAQKYNILILYDNTPLAKADADRIYNAITTFTERKPLLLILYSKGGSAESAYLIGKLCREYSNNMFTVTVPRHAKSAATLICCAANEIHMGSLSELGPIDPQIEGLPALGLKNSIEHIAGLVKQCPESSGMFAQYLANSLNLINLGYYERVAESAEQYAERLLQTHKQILPRHPKEIATELVYKYKDHGFVIDKNEAREIFGENIIKNDTEEYKLGNFLYKALMVISDYLDLFNYYFYFIGSFNSEPSIYKRRQKTS